MKVGILTAVQGRPHISKLFIAGVERLRAEFDILPVAVYSEPKDGKLFKDAGWVTVHHKNEPLGEKYQAGLDYLKDTDVDKVVFTGSDNLISTELFGRLLAETAELVWAIGLYMMCAEGYGKGSIRLYDWFYRIYSGVWRFMDRALLDRVGWQIFGDEDKRVDVLSHKRLMDAKPTIKMIPMLPDTMFDIKSGVNMNMWGQFAQHGITADKSVLGQLSQEERDILKELWQG